MTEPTPKPWSEHNPRLQLAWDSVSMGSIMQCPRKYQYQIIEGWQPNDPHPALEFGIMFHSCMELYEKLLANGTKPEPALVQTVRHALTISKDFIGDSHRTTKVLRTRFTLVRAVIWYVDKFSSQHLRTVIKADGTPAVELSFRIAIPLISPDGTPYILCGHIDRLSEFGEDRMVHDYKHTSRNLDSSYFEEYNPHWQLTNYIFAAQVILPEANVDQALIDAFQAAVGFNRFKRGVTKRFPDQIREWLDNTIYWIKQAERYAEDGYWPMNLQSCHLYGGCQFRKICSMRPHAREEWLKADFHKKPWNPLESRGD